VVDIDRQVAAVAIEQHSLITMADVIAAGGSRSHAQDRVRSGRWERVSPGVYRLAGVPWTYEARVLAGVFAAGPGAVASHRCAARLLNIGFATAPAELSIPRGRFHRPDGVLVHQSTDLDRAAIREVAGIPVTEPSRTLLDLGRYIGHGALRRAVESARRSDLVDWPDLVRCLAVHARQGRHGVRRLRLVLAAGLDMVDITDTDSELFALTLIREHGLPEPVLHHRIRDADGELFAELDFAYPPLMAGLEIDGTVHLDPEVRKRDDARDHELRRRGWMIRRVWWEIPVRQPQLFLQIVRNLVADATPRAS